MTIWTAEKRRNLALEFFGDPENREFPIQDADDIESAAHLIGKADNPGAVKRRIIAIAKKLHLSVPDAWSAPLKESDPSTPESDSDTEPEGDGETAPTETSPRADVLTPQTQQTRTKVGQYSGNQTILTKGPARDVHVSESIALAEAQPTTDRTRREVLMRLISPGWGASRDRMGNPIYYTEQALREAGRVGIFTGRKCYLNHSTAQEKKQRPEGDITRWGATIKESWWDNTQGALMGRGRVVSSPLWEAIELDPDEVGLSINADGTGRVGTVDGQKAYLVEAITRAESVDFVTYPGARGGIVRILESDRAAVRFTAQEQREAERDMLEDLTEVQLREARPDIVEALLKAATPATPAVPDAQAANVALQEAMKPFQDRVQLLERELNNRDAVVLVEKALAACGLPAAAKAKLTSQFARATYGLDGAVYESAEKLVEAVGIAATAEADYIKSVTTTTASAGRTGAAITGMGPTAPVPAQTANATTGVALKEAQVRMDTLLHRLPGHGRAEAADQSAQNRLQVLIGGSAPPMAQ